MYQAIYKCRLCRKKYKINISKQDSQSFEDSAFKNEDCATVPDIKPLHNCKRGMIGIADLQGFKKVGE